MVRLIRFFFTLAWRLFWTAVIIVLLIGLFTRVYPITDGFGRVFLDLIGIMMIFMIFRLFSTRRKTYSR